MICGRHHVLLLGTLVVVGCSGVAFAQTGTGTTQAGRGAKITTATPQPGAKRVSPQGFSVVLVLADLQSAGGQDDVPPAARRALADLKDFLPYKSYKLLDAAWLLGQGGSEPARIQLRGPDDEEYELRLTTTPAAAAAGRVAVRFSLTGSESFERTAHLAARQAEIVDLRRELELLQSDLKKKRQGSDANHPDVKVTEARIAALQERIATASAESTPARRASAVTSPRPAAPRAVIDTSFTMDVGETVVVGTSRLKGNSKALIALLTAVPPRSQGK